MALGIRHSPTAIGAGRIVTKPTRQAEFRGTEEQNVIETTTWYESFVAQRRARGVPVSGLPPWVLERPMGVGLSGNDN